MRLLENVMVLNTSVSDSIVTSMGSRPRIIGLWNNNPNVRTAGIVNPIVASTDPSRMLTDSLQIVSQCRAHCAERLGGEHQHGDQESGQRYRRAQHANRKINRHGKMLGKDHQRPHIRQQQQHVIRNRVNLMDNPPLPFRILRFRCRARSSKVRAMASVLDRKKDTVQGHRYDDQERCLDRENVWSGAELV